MVSLARKNLLHDRIRFAITLAGVAFAVTLVLVQVGLFLGLLGKATVTIENSSADIWIAAKNTSNVDFGNPFPETVFLRARGVPGVERADNAIVQFVNIQLPNGATENALVYGVADPRYWNLPWKVEGGRTEDLKRGYNLMMDQSAVLRFGAFEVGDYRELRGRRFRIIGRSAEAHGREVTARPVEDLNRRFRSSSLAVPFVGKLDTFDQDPRPPDQPRRRDRFRPGARRPRHPDARRVGQRAPPEERATGAPVAS